MERSSKETYPSLFGVEGKVAFVTGAGSGLGAEFAVIMAEAGAEVVCADIDQATANETARKVESAGRRALAVRCDVTDEAAVREAFAFAHRHFGRIDILFNNAGIGEPNPSRSTSSAPRTGSRLSPSTCTGCSSAPAKR